MWVIPGLGDWCDPNAHNNAGVTPMHHAAQRGHLDCISSLIAAGGDVNAVGALLLSTMYEYR
jgi:ankyrin repeat protein